MRQNIVENFRGNYSLSEVADVVPGCCETISFASGIFDELSRLLHSTLETCLNSFQNSIPFLSRINKTNESVANLTRHRYIFSRVKSTSCALICSDWFSGSMRRQLSLDPLSVRAEHCVTERGSRTGLLKLRRKVPHTSALEEMVSSCSCGGVFVN